LDCSSSNAPVVKAHVVPQSVGKSCCRVSTIDDAFLNKARIVDKLVAVENALFVPWKVIGAESQSQPRLSTVCGFQIVRFKGP